MIGVLITVVYYYGTYEILGVIYGAGIIAALTIVFIFLYALLIREPILEASLNDSFTSSTNSSLNVNSSGFGSSSSISNALVFIILLTFEIFGANSHLRLLNASIRKLLSSIEMIIAPSKKNCASNRDAHILRSLKVGSMYLINYGDAVLNLKLNLCFNKFLIVKKLGTG